MQHKISGIALLGLALFCACSSDAQNGKTKDKTGNARYPLPEPGKSKIKFSKVIGWPADRTPSAPAGFKVSAFASGIKSPRNMIVAPNGDVLVALSNSERSLKDKISGALTGKAASEVPGASANTILLYRDADRDGKPETSSLFLGDLNQPFGMAIIGDWFYVANTDGVWKYPYKSGDLKITAAGSKILELPAGGYNNHWTRNLLPNAGGTKLYITVGSGTNVAEHGLDNEIRRANILEINPDGSGEQVYASGLRNPVGMSWEPATGVLWTAVNERDGLGDELVPDYITGVQRGAFYGWPFAYFGPHEDPRLKGKQPEMVQKTIVPDVPLGSHTASLGLAFYTGKSFPEMYHGGAFIGQHGSWNSSKLVGYQVAFVPFKNGKASGTAEEFLGGFIADTAEGTVYGRPVGVTVLPDGALLVADDAGGMIWRVSKE